MDKTLSVQQKKALKQTKPNKKQLKVVYISNPMRVETSPSEFKGLVQELTGQDADVPDASVYSTTRSVGAAGRKGGGVGGHQEAAVPDDGNKALTVEDHSAAAAGGIQQHHQERFGVPPESSDLSSEIGQDYLPELIESFPPGVMPSNMWYD